MSKQAKAYGALVYGSINPTPSHYVRLSIQARLAPKREICA